MQYPGEPRHTHYPPGLPLILAPFVAAFGKNIIVLKLVIMLFGVGGYVFFIKLAKSILPPFYACLVSIAYLLTPALLQYNHWCLSEVPYIFFSLGSVWFMLKGSTTIKTKRYDLGEPSGYVLRDVKFVKEGENSG